MRYFTVQGVSPPKEKQSQCLISIRRGNSTQSFAEHTPNGENGHHVTHENWVIELAFDGGAAAVSAIEIPTNTDAHYRRPL